MKDVFDKHYKEKFVAKGLLPDGKLVHLISDAATMQVRYRQVHQLSCRAKPHVVNLDYSLDKGGLWYGSP
jgi:hypothetical protein